MKAITGTLLIVCVVTLMMFNPSFEMIIVQHNEDRSQLLVTLSNESNSLPSALIKNVYAQPPSKLSENMQNTNDKSKQSAYDLSQLMGLVPIITAIVGVSSGLAVWATHYYQKKQYKLNALIGAFGQLNNLEHRQARSKVYDLFTTWSGGTDEKYLEELDLNSDHVELVKSDFDQIGSLIKNKLVDKQVFLDVYRTTILNYWQYLRIEIDRQKNARKDQLYMKNFKWLVDEAEEFQMASG